MGELRAVVTRKGQVTIPAEVRKALDLQGGDLLVFTLPENPIGKATVHRMRPNRPSVVERTAGMLKGDLPPLDPRAEREAAEEGWASVALERMGE